jgi:signal transduction histidine kinase
MKFFPQLSPKLQNRVTLDGRMQAALQRRADGLAPLTEETRSRPAWAAGRAVSWVGAAAAAILGLVAVWQVTSLASHAAVGGAVGLLTAGFAVIAATRALDGFRSRVETRARQLERRRIACDLHDGLAQELAFISMQAHRFALAGGDARARDIAEAAARAMSESRQVIEDLTRTAGDPFEAQLEQVTGRLAERGGATVRVAVGAALELDPTQHQNLLRIAGEAVNNAVRHGGATEIDVALRTDDGLRLTIRDNGAGFRSAGHSARGFGLLSMRARATAIGGQLRVRSSAGRGAEVEVAIR